MVPVMLTCGGNLLAAPAFTSDCGEISTGTPEDLEILQRGGVCMANFNPVADRPIYRRTYEGKTLRFYINPERLLLIAPPGELHQRFPEDLLKIWFDDAQHWLKWLEGIDDSWCCRG